MRECRTGVGHAPFPAGPLSSEPWPRVGAALFLLPQAAWVRLGRGLTVLFASFFLPKVRPIQPASVEPVRDNSVPVPPSCVEPDPNFFLMTI